MNIDEDHNRCDVPQEPDDANGDQFFGVPEPDEIAQGVGGAAKKQKVGKCFGCGAFGGNWLSCPRNPEAVGSKSHRARRLEARGMQPMHADGGGGNQAQRMATLLPANVATCRTSSRRRSSPRACRHLRGDVF